MQMTAYLNIAKDALRSVSGNGVGKGAGLLKEIRVNLFSVVVFLVHLSVQLDCNDDLSWSPVIARR